MSTLNLGDSLIMNSDIVVNGGEVKTGATWRGKSVYVKAFSGTIGNDGTLSIITNISTTTYGRYSIIRIEGFTQTSEPCYIPINWYNGTAYCSCFASRSSATIKTNKTDLYSRPVYIWIYFTDES